MPRSHSQETFADSREGEESDTIVGVGDYLTQLLTENYGYQVVHLKEQFDMAGGELDRSAAYDYARDYLEPYLQENPDIQVKREAIDRSDSYAYDPLRVIARVTPSLSVPKRII